MNKLKKDTFMWVDWMIRERESKGMSQADLARASGLTRSAISDYERRLRVNPDVKALSKISEALGYPAEYLPRLANQFPNSIELDDTQQQIVFEASTLTEQEMAEVIAFIRLKKNLRRK